MTEDKNNIKHPMDAKTEETKAQLEMEKQQEIRKARINKFRMRIAEEKQVDEDDPLFNKLISENDKIKPAFEIAIDNESKLNIWIPNAKSFKITNEKNKTVFPFTTSKGTSWYSSTYYRNKLIKTIKEKYDLKNSKAEDIIFNLCDLAGEHIQNLIDNPVLSDEIQAIFDNIERVKVTRQDREGPQDSNIFEIYIQDEIIKLTDEQLYSGPKEFCLQYFNRFFHILKIDPADWGLFYEKLKEEKLEIDEEKIDSTLDNIIDKLLKYIQSKKVRNWLPVKNRRGHLDSIYYDCKKCIIKISSDFINRFFEREKIWSQYHISTQSLASKLKDEKVGLLAGNATTGKTTSSNKGSVKFWNFYPDKLEISKDDILEEDDEKSIAKENLDYFGDGNE